MTKLATVGAPMRKAMAWMALCAFGWMAAENILVLLHRPYPLMEIVWWRYAAHMCFVVLLWGAFGTLRLRTKRPLFHAARGLLMLIMPGALALAIHIAGASAGFEAVFWVAPLFILAIGALARETPSVLAAILAVLGAAAAAAVYGHVSHAPLTTLFLALASAASFALYVVMTRQLGDEATSANLLYTAAPVFLVLCFVVPPAFVVPDLHDAAIFALVGAFGLVMLFALDRACAEGPAWLGASALFLQPVMVVTLGLMLHGAMDHRALWGVIALVGICAAQWTLSYVRVTPGSGTADASA
jgi:drug/metabolite transporter (DMT)-like permease